MNREVVFGVVATLVLCVIGVSCSDDGGSGGETTLTVSAASSLTEAFDEIAAEFEQANDGVTVQLTYDRSSSLAAQIEEGAPADVFAPADEANMQRVAEADLVSGEATVFATNGLIIVTKPGNPLGITGVNDLDKADVIALCDEAAPCGQYAAEVLENAALGIEENHITRGENAKATVTAVAEGDADAGIVYVSDLQAAGDALAGVDIPDDLNVTASYPIAVLEGGSDDDAAQEFVDYVLGDEGQAVLADHGFLPPP